MEVFSAWCVGYRHGAAKWRPWGRKMTRVGSPWSTKGAKGSPIASKMLQKIIENQHPSPGLPPRVLLGCLGCPTAPKIRPFLTFPRPALPHVGGTFHLHLPLCPTPHSLAPPHCEASLERGGLGVCPLGSAALLRNLTHSACRAPGLLSFGHPPPHALCNSLHTSCVEAVC